MDEPLRDDEDPMPAFGMWRDREDMADVEAHMRELRKGRQLAVMPMPSTGRIAAGERHETHRQQAPHSTVRLGVDDEFLEAVVWA